MHTDIVIAGSGFGGALLSMALRRHGYSVTMLERGRHPRFVIGESTTPLANVLLEQFADRYALPRVRALSKWGTWQAVHPNLGCGLKRGFTFVWEDTDLMVAASPRDEVADTHWYRPDVDWWLVREAQALGVDYRDRVVVDHVELSDAGVSLTGPGLDVRGRLLVDATGPRGFLQQALGLPESAPRWLPGTQALYAHFTGVERWAPEAIGDQTPFPPDDAALHHVFPGGWMWVLRFGNGVTSAGVAVTDALAAQLGLADGGDAWPRVLAHVPRLARQFAGAVSVTPFVYTPRVAFRAPDVFGPGWVRLSSAVGVIDPLLSTGIPLTLLGVERLASLLGRGLDDPGLPSGLAVYAAQTQAELDATERLVAGLYASFADPSAFKRLALLYFAAASFSETLQRLGTPEKAGGFLLRDRADFSAALARVCEAARRGVPAHERAAWMDDIAAAIAPIDVGGWLRADRGDRFPVDLNDLRSAVTRLDTTPDALEAMIRSSGLGATGVFS